MKEIRMQTAPARDKHASDEFLLARLSFTRDRMAIAIGERRAERATLVSVIWEHTVYELENLASAIRFAASGNLPSAFTAPSPDVLMGPVVNLRPCIQIELGKSLNGGIDGALFFCSARNSPFAKRRLLYLAALLKGCGMSATFEVEDALALSDQIYAQAKALAPRFVNGP